MRTPNGITPPAPGLDREEPEFTPFEEDIPEDATVAEGTDPGRATDRE